MIESTTVRGHPVFWSRGVRNLLAVKPLSLVPDSDRDFSVHVAAAVDVDALVRVLPGAVNYGIRQGFTQSRLDVDLASISASKLQNEAHELINELGDGRDATWDNDRRQALRDCAELIVNLGGLRDYEYGRSSIYANFGAMCRINNDG